MHHAATAPRGDVPWRVRRGARHGEGHPVAARDDEPCHAATGDDGPHGVQVSMSPLLHFKDPVETLLKHL
jgi:hypothetical protein